MHLTRTERRNQMILLLGGLALALAYFGLFRPLAARVDALEPELAGVARQLTGAQSSTNGPVRPIHLGDIRQRLTDARRLGAALAAAEKALLPRCSLDATNLARLKEPFSLIAFHGARDDRLARILALARERKVKLETPLVTGLPDYTATLREPDLLWAELVFAHHLVVAAIQLNAQVIQSLTVLRDDGQAMTNSPWREVRLRVELVTDGNAAHRLLAALPLLPGELAAAGLPDWSPEKPALFLDRLLLRKQTPEKPDEVALELTVCGLVPRLEPAPAREGP